MTLNEKMSDLYDNLCVSTNGMRLSRRHVLAGSAVLLGAGAFAGSSLRSNAPVAAHTQTAPPTEEESVRIYVLRDGGRRGPLMAVLGRVVDVSEGRVATAAIWSLLDGITEEERALGIDTAIPEGVALREATLDAETGTVRIDFSEPFASNLGVVNVAPATGEETPRVNPADMSDDPPRTETPRVAPADMSDDSPDMLAELTPEHLLRLRQAQVVHTVTQFETITGVEFFVEGEPLAVLDREGNEIAGPATRETFEDLSPLILVEEPVPFAVVGASFTARGTANTFEATLQMRVLDEAGETVFENFYTATSGSGTRGTFEAPVTLPPDLPAGDITLMAFEYSARDGSIVSDVLIPLTYAP